MSENNKDGHPFEEDLLKQALSESLQTPSGSNQTDSDQQESGDPLYNEDRGMAESEEDNHKFMQVDDESRFVAEDLPVKNTSTYTEVEDGLNTDAASEINVSGNVKNMNNSGLSRIVIAVVILSTIGFTVSNWKTSQKIDTLTAQLESVEAMVNHNPTRNAGQAENEKEQQAGSSDQRDEEILMQLLTQTMENREAIKGMRQLLTASASQNNRKSAAITSAAAVASKESVITMAATVTEVPAVTDKPEKQILQTAKSIDGKKTESLKPKIAKPASYKKSQGWNIILTSLKNEANADRELAALQGIGMQVEKHAVKVRGETFYQLRTGWFKQKDDALAYIKNVISSKGYKGAWARRME